jgi:hypothetical protein
VVSSGSLHHDVILVTEILLKVELNTITLTLALNPKYTIVHVK